MGRVRSMEKGAALLAILARADGPLRLSEIASRAEMIPSMAHSYLASLAQAGLVSRKTPAGLYDLGEAALHLGLAALTRLDFASMAREAMRELAGINQTVLLSVWSDRGPVVVDKIEGLRESIYEVRIGSVVPLTETVTGRTFMAFLPEAAWAGLAKSAVGAIERRKLDKELQKIVSRRIALPLAGLEPRFPAIGAPIFDHHGEIKGVLTVLGRSGSFAIETHGTIKDRMKAVSTNLSRRLGWTQVVPVSGTEWRLS